MKYIEKPATWRDVEKFIKEHRLDMDEYFMLDMGTSPNEPVWTPQTRCIAVWLSEGSNEGFYVHIDAISLPRSEDTRTIKAGGKFWSVEAGMRAVNLLTRYIYGFELYSPAFVGVNEPLASPLTPEPSSYSGPMPVDEAGFAMVGEPLEAVEALLPKAPKYVTAPAFVVMMGLATFPARDEEEALAIEERLKGNRVSIRGVTQRIKRYTWKQVTDRDFEKPVHTI